MLTREAAIMMVYGDRPDDPPMDETINVHICKMRKKLESFDVKIATVWGRGYRLDQQWRETLKP